MHWNRVGAIMGRSAILLFVIAEASTAQGFSYADPVLPRGEIPRSDSAARGALLHILDSRQPGWGTQAMTAFFGTTYDSRLPDLVVYIDSGDTVRGASLVQGDDEKSYLYGEKSVWVIIFARRNLTVPDTVTADNTVTDTHTSTDTSHGRHVESTVKRAITSAAFTVKRDVLGYEKGPRSLTISTLLTGISQMFFGAALTNSPSNPNLSDSSRDISMSFLGDSAKGTGNPIYFSEVRFALAVNSYNRILVEPKATLPFVYYNYNVENADNSTFGGSLGAGYSLANRNVNLFLLFHTMLIRPRKPITDNALSVVLGLDINDKSRLFDHIVLGGRTSLSILWEKLGGLGFFYGVSSKNVNDRIKWLLCTGIDTEL